MVAAGLLLGSAASRAQGPQGPALSLARLAVVRDSLTQLLATQPRPDTLRVLRLNTLAFALRLSDPAQAQPLAWQALALARRLGYARGLVEAHFNVGYNARAHNQYDSAIYHSRQALRWARRLRNPLTESRALFNLSRSYSEQGNYAAALGPSLDGLTLTRTLPSRRPELLQLLQAARIAAGLGEYPEARAHIAAALRLLPAAPDAFTRGSVYLVLGDVERRQGQWAAAHRAYTQAHAAYQPVTTARGQLPLELNLAEMQQRLGQPLAARRATHRLLHLLQPTATPEQLAQANLLLARNWLPARPDSARPYAARALAAARPAHLRPQARDAAQLLAGISDQLGQGHTAYQHQLLASAYADTLSGEAANRQLAAAQARAARSRTQTQLDLLQQQTRLRQQQQELERLQARQQLAGTVGIAGLLLLLAGGAFWQYRRRQAAARAAAAQALRQRLAADLHDDVGNLLTQISMQSSLLREVPGSPAQLLARLDQLTTTARQATQQMSDVVWGLHQTQQTLPALLDRMRDHAHEVLYPLGLEVDFEVSPAATAAPLAPETLQSLYLIYKEALHNVVKHARATRVTIRLDASPTGLHLTVADDGQGHDGSARAGGHGLRNMQARAQAVGGTVQYEKAAPGFLVVVELPAAGVVARTL
ncbi:tetratricopeptide repeat-containing sensor histidine kinase [Hymenobacter aranciens]|uniref:tetratricopeptide repeat-containing sensor histidine kinase n=1 Tax=Hymenobacter aranciens TaxID=3063996 RepID=UPI00272A7B0C|nr:histidine kinase [Hymenobacter sp. ASUV-10]